MTKDQALKLALKALKKCRYRSLADEIVDPAITAINEALAQTQEPVSDDIASILACRDMLDAQPVSEADRVIWPESTEQEPVAWGVFDHNLHDMFFTKEDAQEMVRLKGDGSTVKPLYTAPPQRKPLTLVRIEEIFQEASGADDEIVERFARGIEAAHGIKEQNT